MKRILQLAALLALGLLIGAASAQTKPAAKPPVVAKVPTIPDAVQKEFWKAQAQVKSAQEALQAAQQKSAAAVAEIQAACGADFQAEMNPQGDPVCVAKVKK